MATFTLTYYKYSGYNENVKCDLKEGTYTIGESVTVNVTPDEGCTITEAPYFRYYNSGTWHKLYFKQSTENEKIYTTTTAFNFVDSGSSVQLYMKAEPTHFVLKQHLENCTSDRTDGEFPLNEDITITLTAMSGYEFQEIPILYYLTSSGRPIEKPFNMVSSTVYTLTISFDINESVSVDAKAEKQSVVTDKYGILTIYMPDKDIMKTMASRWFMKTSADGYVATGDYIVSLVKLYCNIEADDIQELMLGPYSMEIDCPVIGTDIINIDCGTVHITGRYGNVIDYENTDIEIYLPFIGFTALKTPDFMDKDINLSYQVNVINGDALAVLKADGIVIATFNCNVSFKIPYRTNANADLEKTIEPNNNYLLDAVPCIYVKSHVSAMPESRPYHDTNIYARLGDLSGYTEVKEIDFEVLSEHITKTEIDEIKSLLENGVFL